MKFLALMIALLPTIASADFVPGRVRTAAIAKMEVLDATGIYRGVKEVTMNAVEQDGKGVIGYNLSVDGQPMKFTVTKLGKNTGCGQNIEAAGLMTMESDRSNTLIMKDMTYATCEIMVQYKWQVTVETRALHSSSVSTLVLGGNAQYLMHTM